MSLFRVLFYMLLFFVSWPVTAWGQGGALWLDIGDLHNLYVPEGAVEEGDLNNLGMQWPANLRLSGHTRSEAFWIGLKSWTNSEGETQEYKVVRNGPRSSTNEFVIMDHRLVSRWPETVVMVNGAYGGRNEQIIDDINPDLPADRMIISRIRTAIGVEVERRAYAFGNEFHDDYHIIERTFTNTGNTDLDDEIELDGQNLSDVYFMNAWRWTGRVQAASHATQAQQWGKFNMIDVVGDGNENYPVDFTAIYSWAGYDPAFSRWNNLGSPMIDQQGSSAPADTIGRLAGMSMQGLVVLHADNDAMDETYNPLVQPKTLGFLDSDETFVPNESLEQDLYELVILTRENPAIVEGGSSRMYPHYADRVEPEGTFWEPTVDASQGKQGGHQALVSYGPYNMDINNQVRIVEALVADGLSYDAATEIGRAYKRSGTDDSALISYDANGDGAIDETPFDYSAYNSGAERLTKNQWFMTSRDSMFNSMNLARQIWDLSDGMNNYVFDAVPLPPQKFEVNSTRDMIMLRWEPHFGASDPNEWKLYKTTEYLDNQPYELLATLPGNERSFEDTEVVENVNYFYYLQAVGEPTIPDPLGVSGTPSGAPFKSSLHYTQTYIPIRLGSTVEIPAIGARVGQNNPNPFDQSTSIPYAVNGPEFAKVTIVDLLGREVITLVDRFFEVDFADDVTWDGHDKSGRLVPSGVYFCQIVTTLGRDVIPIIVAR